MAGWGVLLLGAALIWFSTTFDRTTAAGARNAGAVLWIGVLTIVGCLAELLLSICRADAKRAGDTLDPHVKETRPRSRP